MKNSILFAMFVMMIAVFPVQSMEVESCEEKAEKVLKGMLPEGHEFVLKDKKEEAIYLYEHVPTRARFIVIGGYPNQEARERDDCIILLSGSEELLIAAYGWIAHWDNIR